MHAYVDHIFGVDYTYKVLIKIRRKLQFLGSES